MRIVVTGGRDYLDSCMVHDVLDTLKPTEVFVGDCPTGADCFARDWAKEKNIPLTVFRADWDIHGKVAGPIRNKEMLEKAGPDAFVVAFQGGKGTYNCVKRAKNLNMLVAKIEP